MFMSLDVKEAATATQRKPTRADAPVPDVVIAVQRIARPE
jgi:hypothetical protein